MCAELTRLLGADIERLLSVIPAGAYAVDADGEVRVANDRAEEIWGGPLPNCLTQSEGAWYSGRLLDAAEDLLVDQWPVCRSLKQGERVFAEIIDIVRFDGAPATIITGSTPLRSDDDMIVGALSVLQDVSGPREQHRTDQLLLEVLGALAGSLDLGEVLDRLVHVLLDTGEHSRASVMLWHEETGELELAAVVGKPEVTAGSRFRLDEYSMALQRAVSERTRAIVDFSRMPAEQLGLAGQQGLAGTLIVPLVRGDDFLGVVTVDEMRADIGFSPREIALIESIAASAALAIENARLYQTERHIADTLQRALLSLPDRVEGLAFAHAYRSASEAAFVGGDFYDLFEIERDLVGVLIGDVAGKGLDAAVLTQLLKNTVRAHALEKGGSPATILRLTNDIFFQVTSPDMFATAFFGVLDRSTGRLVYTNAGHTDAIIMRANGELVELPADSPLLGAFARRTFIQSEVDLKSNDLLLLYTDGVTEARSGSLLYGEERLMRNLARAGSRSPVSLVRAVVDDVLRFTAGRLSDDLAILVVQRLDGQAESPRVQQLEVSVT
jgi:PAS domain-containing protein